MLSICMIVKNEEKNLISNLPYLSDFLKNKVELIIVDTGSNDSTIKIAKKYTEKIYFKEWKDDFSEARNYSLKMASNDWIMVIDADERPMSSYSEIKKAIEIAESKNIFAIEVLIRNYLPNSGFNIDKQIRIFKKNRAKYKNVVHNQLIFDEKPVILKSTIVVEHFGYANPEVLVSKRQRTVKLIEKTLEKEPANLYMIQQLARAYFALNNYEKAFEYANIISEKIFKKELKVKSNGLFFLESLVIAGKSLFEMKRYENIEKYYTIALKIFPKYIDALLLLSELYFFSGKIKKCEKTLIEYIKLHDELLKNINKIKIPPTNTFGMKLSALRFLIVVFNEENKIDKFKSYLKEYLTLEKEPQRKSDIMRLFNAN